MTKLSVNVNKVALLRNSRHLDIPNVLRAVRLCLDAGAHGITVHPRPDERHIRRKDTYEVAAELALHPDVEFNIEGNPFLPPFLDVVGDLKPAQCTLVPDATEALTSDHGWSLDEAECRRLEPVIESLKRLGVRVSLFMDADAPAIGRAGGLGADRIELFTEPFAAAFGTPQEGEIVREFQKAAAAARAAGLGVNAGHDLNRQNLPLLLSSVRIDEVSIGHALVGDALEFGLGPTVKQYLQICAGQEIDRAVQ